MKVDGKRVMLCSCENTMSLDIGAISAGLNAQADEKPYHHLCRSQIAAYQDALASGEALIVACAQEAPLFADLAEQADKPSPTFVDVRDRAGWSSQAKQAGPKMAALIAEAALDMADTPSVALESQGRIIVLGGGQDALNAAAGLSKDRNVQIILTDSSDELTPPDLRNFTIRRGRVVKAAGALGNWTLTVEAMADAKASSRARLEFQPPASGQVLLNCDVVLDLTDAPALIRNRDGWIRADRNSRIAVAEAAEQARDLFGEFEKPRYIKIDTALCAHSRNTQIACTRCMDACPSSSIIGKGDHALVDPHACGGHGSCASACPTGAIQYDFPADNGLFKRLERQCRAYRDAGGKVDPILLAYDAESGGAMLSALARYGDGLPAHVLPFAVNAVAACGLDFLLDAATRGFVGIVVLADPGRRVDLQPLQDACELTDNILHAMGWGARCRLVVDRDPEALITALDFPAVRVVAPAAEHMVLGRKRQTLALALAHLHRNADNPPDLLPLAAGAPFGAVLVDQAKCTMCLACIGVCPASALSGHPDKPSLGFLEMNCVQCGLCKVTCPEKAIALEPRLNFQETARNRQILKEESPYECVRCGKPFGTKSSIERMLERLAGHSMFAQNGRLELIKMCEDCRVVAQYEAEEGARPMAGAARPAQRTTDDYLKKH